MEYGFTLVETAEEYMEILRADLGGLPVAKQILKYRAARETAPIFATFDSREIAILKELCKRKISCLEQATSECWGC